MNLLFFGADSVQTGVSTTASVFVQILIFGLPLILAAYAGMTSERSGIINLGLEGLMCFGAFAGFLVLRAFTPVYDGTTIRNYSAACLISPQIAVFLAIIVAAIVGGIFSLLLSFAAIHLKANQTIVGTAINILSTSLIILVAWVIQGSGNTGISTPIWVRITAESFGQPSFVMPTTGVTGLDYAKLFFSKLLFENFFLTTPVIILILIAVAYFLFKTKTGLRIRACGENPQAADSVGINVAKMRYLGTTLGGVLAGVAGFALCLAIGYNATVIGFGFLALAVMIFGNWKPGRIVIAGIIFAFFRILSNVSGILPTIPLINYEYLYYTIPYVITIIVLIFSSKTSHAPKAEGIPYDKGAR
jgi:general nucleoside transport system permease protein